jgi:uncharacterized cupredoxin-like copper-binding protein
VNPANRRFSIMNKLLVVLAATAWLASGAQVFAHGDERGKKTVKKISQEEKEFGRQGDPRKVGKTIEIDMADTMRFAPDTVTVRTGDTIKFVVRNSGKQTHEMVIGTEKELKEHAALMLKFPTMEHEEPYMIHVAAGKKEEMIWQVTRPGEFHFGCLIPGHFEAGMKGRIVVVSK